MLCDLVKEGLLKIEDAAKRMNVSEEVFLENEKHKVRKFPCNKSLNMLLYLCIKE